MIRQISSELKIETLSDMVYCVYFAFSMVALYFLAENLREVEIIPEMHGEERLWL